MYSILNKALNELHHNKPGTLLRLLLFVLKLLGLLQSVRIHISFPNETFLQGSCMSKSTKINNASFAYMLAYKSCKNKEFLEGSVYTVFCVKMCKIAVCVYRFLCVDLRT